MAFPSSPTNGQTYTANGTTYVYDSGLGVWDVQGASTVISGVTSVAGRTGVVTLTASDVSLGNATNESKATMFTNSTFTGTTTLATVSAGAITASSLSISGTISAGNLSVSGINNTAIGSTTASSGAFTTLSASGTSTLAGVSATSLSVSGTVTGTFSGAINGTVGASTPAAGAFTTITASSTLAATGLITGAVDIRSLGQIRATGWYNSPTGSSYTGLACEIGISGGAAYILSYNRDSSSYGALNLSATSTTINNSTNLTSLGVGTAASGTTGEGRFTNQIVAYYSDERLKTKISTIENALDKIDQLTGFLYVENDLARSLGFNNPNVQTALSAQAVKRVQPEVVKPAPFDIAQRDDGTEYSKSGEDYLTVDYEKLIPLIVEGIKELRREINQLKGK